MLVPIGLSFSLSYSIDRNVCPSNFDKKMRLGRTQFLSEKKGKIKLAAVKHGIRKDGRL